MARFEPLLSVRFKVELAALPLAPQSHGKGVPLMGPTLRSLGCIEDWRGGLVVVEPRDRPILYVIPYARVADLVMGMESIRDQRSPFVDTLANSARSSTPLLGAVFRKDLAQALPGGQPLPAGSLLQSAQVRSLRLDRTLCTAVLFAPLGVERELSVSMDDVVAVLVPNSGPASSQ